MKTVQFRIEDKQLIHDQFGFGDWEERLTRLGYIKEVEIGDNYEAITFAQIYLAHRRSLHHRNQTLITDQSSQWTLLKRVTDEALEFMGAMNDAVNMREGFVYYLQLAGEQDWVALKDIRYKGKQLVEIYEAEKIVDNDPDSMGTDLMVAEYTKELMKRTGYVPVVKTAKDYLPFIEAAKLAKEHYMTASQYIPYLAEKWEWAGALKPNQLHGKKAEEYLRDSGADPEAIRQRMKGLVKKVKKKKGASRF